MEVFSEVFAQLAHWAAEGGGKATGILLTVNYCKHVFCVFVGFCFVLLKNKKRDCMDDFLHYYQYNVTSASLYITFFHSFEASNEISCEKGTHHKQNSNLIPIA